MSRLSLVVLLAVVSLLVDNNEAVRVRSGAVRLGTNPGIAFRLDKSVLDKAIHGATRLAGKHAKSIPLPDIAATISGVELQIKQLAITEFDEPQLQYRFAEPNRVIGSIELPKLCVEGPYNATRSTLIKTQHDSGNINFLVNKIKVNFEAAIGECETGTPNFEKFDCTTEMGPANLNVKNAKEKFAIEVLSLGARMIRPAVTTQVCSTVKRLLLDEVNRKLALIPNVIALHPSVAIKYQIKPKFTADAIQVGLFTKLLTEAVNPELPKPFTECPMQNSHVAVFISDVVFNELAYHAHANGIFKYTCKSKDFNIHPLVSALFSLKCDCEKEVCLGCVLPHLAEKYGPEADVQFTVKADKAPRLTFATNKASFTISGHGELAITPARPGAETQRESGSVEITGSLQPKIHQQRLYAKASVDSVKIAIDNKPNQQYEQKVLDYCKKTTEEIINDFLFRGLPLDVFPFGVKLVDPQICIRDGTFQANTGFDHQPSQAQ